jgi:hypothetical protein
MMHDVFLSAAAQRWRWRKWLFDIISAGVTFAFGGRVDFSAPLLCLFVLKTTFPPRTIFKLLQNSVGCKSFKSRLWDGRCESVHVGKSGFADGARVHHRTKLKAFLSPNAASANWNPMSDKTSCKLHSWICELANARHPSVICWRVAKAAGMHTMHWQMQSFADVQTATRKRLSCLCDYTRNLQLRASSMLLTCIWVARNATHSCTLHDRARTLQRRWKALINVHGQVSSPCLIAGITLNRLAMSNIIFS